MAPAKKRRQRKQGALHAHDAEAKVRVTDGERSAIHSREVSGGPGGRGAAPPSSIRSAIHSRGVSGGSGGRDAAPPSATRLDLALIKRHPDLSRRKARDVIEKGQVSVDGRTVREAGEPVG
ncbi:MAG: S4 domain-containing protein, partial [Solirubrobacterales bacterium]